MSDADPLSIHSRCFYCFYLASLSLSPASRCPGVQVPPGVLLSILYLLLLFLLLLHRQAATPALLLLFSCPAPASPLLLRLLPPNTQPLLLECGSRKGRGIFTTSKPPSLRNSFILIFRPQRFRGWGARMLASPCLKDRDRTTALSFFLASRCSRVKNFLQICFY